MRILSTFLALLLLCFSLSVHATEAKKKSKSKPQKISTASPAAGAAYAKRQDVQAWAEQMAPAHQLDVKWVKLQLAHTVR